MPIELRRTYLNEIRLRYQNRTKKKEKSLILNEFCAVCGYSRKYAIRILKGQLQPRLNKPGPKSKYDENFVVHLVELWEAMGRICSKKLKYALPNWLPFYEDATPDMKALLLSVSPSTIDRLLKPYRYGKRKGISSTRPSLIKNKIPLKLLDEEIKYPGFIEADTVAHCGESLSGEFVSTLTMTDLFSGWTENRALWRKTSESVVKQVGRIEKRLPFDLTGFACDNGTEFLNTDLHDYLVKNRQTPLNFVRRRPYKNNDNAHVEQKNFTHVRQLVGYDRIDEEHLVGLMNEIYQAYFNPLQNFFIPSMKLIKKERHGAKVKKSYDKPKTPYQRLMDSTYVPKIQKRKLKEQYLQKNPFFLRKELDKKLKELFGYLDKKKNLKYRATGSDS